MREGPVSPTRREEATARMYQALRLEITPRVGRQVWDRLQPGGAVDRADRELVISARQFESGEVDRTAVVAAAERLREAWTGAIGQLEESSVTVDEQQATD